MGARVLAEEPPNYTLAQSSVPRRRRPRRWSKETDESKSKWIRAFLSADPRGVLADFFRPGDERGPYGFLRHLSQYPSIRDPDSQSHHFSVWRPTSLTAMRMLFEGSACGKALNIKGKSALKGELCGFVPFLQISEEKHKAKVATSPPEAVSTPGLEPPPSA